MPKHSASGASVIWVLFGNTTGADEDVVKLRTLYAELRADFESRGLTLGLPSQGTSKKGFLTLLNDPATVAVVWHSHANGNEIGAADGATIRPSDIKGVSTRLQYVALIGCDILSSRTRQSEWLRAFHLTQFPDKERRLFSTGYMATLWDQYVGSRKVIGIGRKFASRSANRFEPYHLSDWLNNIDRL